jgi:DNA modification methylase
VAAVLRGNALALPLPDNSVDLVVTSPPYFGLRSYQDAGEHYTGQIGDEPTPTEFLDALIAATREMVRVVKPSGSIFVNLGDKYAGSAGWAAGTAAEASSTLGGRRQQRIVSGKPRPDTSGARPKSLILIPERYRVRCVDELGLIARAVIVWSKPNGLPESVTDRVRRSHEDWVHFTLNPRYYSAVDEIREPHAWQPSPGYKGHGRSDRGYGPEHTFGTQVDHFAAFPTEWPRRIIAGWSPRGICTVCGEGRRPVSDKGHVLLQPTMAEKVRPGLSNRHLTEGRSRRRVEVDITGEACACPHPTAPTTPGTVLDPFGGTGTTALVAVALGRHGITLDMSRDYCRLATWRTSDPKSRAKAARREFTPPPEQTTGQLDLLEGLA